MSYAISRAWLNAQHHRFPVVLDPTFTEPAPVAGTDCTIFNNAPTASQTATCASSAPVDSIGSGAGNWNYAGGMFVTMMNFPDDLAGIPSDSEVLAANLTMTMNILYGTEVSYAVLPMSDSFTPNQGSWQYADLATGQKWQCPGGDFVGCQTGSPSMIAGTGTFSGSGTSIVSITSLAQAWVDGSQPSTQQGKSSYLPLMLYPTSTSGDAEIDRFAATGAPVLTITWAPRLGGDPGSTIQSTSIDQNTGIGINVANGNVQVNRSDLDIPGIAGMNLDLSHTYNSNPPSTAWTLDQPASLSPGVDTGSEVLTGSDGNQSVWNLTQSGTWSEGGTYTSAPGVNARLCESLPNGGPASVIDTSFNPYVFYVGSNGQIQGLQWSSTYTQWEPFNPSLPLGSAGTAGVSTSVSTVAPNSRPAVLIEGTSNPGGNLGVQVFYVDSNLAIAEWSYTTATVNDTIVGAWTDQELPSASVGPATSPAVMQDSSGNKYVYYNDGQGHIHELSVASGSSWTDWAINAPGTSEPAAPYTSPAAVLVVSGSTKDRYISYVGVSNPTTDGIYEWSLTSGWSGQQLATSAAVSSSPSAVAAPNGQVSVFYTGVTTTTGVLPVGSLTMNEVQGPTWGSPTELPNTTSPATVAPNTSPAATLDTNNNPNVYYTGSDLHFARLSWSGSTWSNQDPLSLPMAAGTSPATPNYGSTPVYTPFYIGADDQLHEADDNGAGWSDVPLGGQAAASGCQPRDNAATWELTYYSSGERLDFNSAGQLIAAYDRNGNVILYTYNTSGADTGLVSQITDTENRIFNFTYTYSGQPATLTQMQIADVAGGRTITLNISNGNVTSDTDAAQNTTVYGYTTGKLTTITDPSTGQNTLANATANSLAYGTTTIAYTATVSLPAGVIWQESITRPGPTTPTNSPANMTTYTSYSQSVSPPAGYPTCGGSPSGELPYGYTIVNLPGTSAGSNWREYCYDTHDRIYETFDEVTRQPTITTYDANDDITAVVEPTNTEYGSPTLVTSRTFDACFRPKFPRVKQRNRRDSLGLVVVWGVPVVSTCSRLGRWR